MNNTISIAITDDSLAYDACIYAGERAIIKLTNTSKAVRVGDIVYHAFKSLDSGGFYRVHAIHGALVCASGIGANSNSVQTLPHKCRLFGVLVGSTVSFTEMARRWREKSLRDRFEFLISPVERPAPLPQPAIAASAGSGRVLRFPTAAAKSWPSAC